MSQEKVARYKEQKANRKEMMKKQKAKKMLGRCIWSVVGIAFVVMVGFSAYDLYEKAQPRQVVEADYTEFDNYLNELSEEAE